MNTTGYLLLLVTQSVAPVANNKIHSKVQAPLSGDRNSEHLAEHRKRASRYDHVQMVR